MLSVVALFNSSMYAKELTESLRYIQKNLKLTKLFKSRVRFLKIFPKKGIQKFLASLVIQTNCKLLLIRFPTPNKNDAIFQNIF
jgi:hypothetical protein